LERKPLSAKERVDSRLDWVDLEGRTIRDCQGDVRSAKIKILIGGKKGHSFT